jgi:hypothetical protein
MAYSNDNPVVRYRVNERTKVKKDLFVNALKRVHNVSVACEILGIARTMVYEWREGDKEFAKRWDDAILFSKEALESGAYVLLTQVYTDGRRKLSMSEERLTEFILTGMFPDKYRQRAIEIENNQINNFTIDWSKVPDEDVLAFNAGQLTLQDVYDRSLQHAQQKEPDTSADRRAEGSGET